MRRHKQIKTAVCSQFHQSRNIFDDSFVLISRDEHEPEVAGHRLKLRYAHCDVAMGVYVRSLMYRKKGEGCPCICYRFRGSGRVSESFILAKWYYPILAIQAVEKIKIKGACAA